MANKPNNPSLWSKAKSLAKQKFDVYPSAYANGWAAKWYKSKGGTWRKAQYGMEVPMMEDGGKPEWLLKAQLKAQGYSGNALDQKLAAMAQGGEPQNAGFQALPEYVQSKILSNMAYGGIAYPFMEEGGEPNGEMALGQMAAVSDKMAKLLKFVKPDDNLDPWIASKLAVMDHSADAISDYMMYGAEGDEEMEESEMEESETEEMKMGGIPQRYRNMGFNKVGVKKQSTRPGKKWMVLAKKGDQYKVVHGGYKGMQDFKQHGSQQRKENFWNRMGGRNSSKATDPFSPLYWHKRFGTWQEGGEIDMPDMKNGGSTFSGNAWYNMGGYVPEYGMGGMPCYECGGMYAEGGESEMMAPEPDPGYGRGYGKRGFLGMKPVKQWTGKNDSKLEDFIEYLDPTGITRWDDAVGAIRNFKNKKGNALRTAIAIAGALPRPGRVFFPGSFFVDEMPKWAQTVHKLRGLVGDVGGFYQGMEKATRGVLKGLGPYDYTSPSFNYKQGGGIHINPANKGKFTASAKRAGMGVQEFAAHVLANKEDYSTTQIKRANFARNAAQWNKQYGGPVEGEVMDVTPEQLEELRRQGYQFEMI
jgi:hypothetical protein